ncbi:hypothetical protein T05_16081 [Trichinella murrelli]|uniref:Uncharacterized protein n=1 Tax=Trichinella murrelli TaxID=144512 RepID=A0A0V0U991_9BILA|nr:hypothetical protein T05_16081 [Trichinella murrelli]
MAQYQAFAFINGMKKPKYSKKIQYYKKLPVLFSFLISIIALLTRYLAKIKCKNVPGQCSYHAIIEHHAVAALSFLVLVFDLTGDDYLFAFTYFQFE